MAAALQEREKGGDCSTPLEAGLWAAALQEREEDPQKYLMTPFVGFTRSGGVELAPCMEMIECQATKFSCQNMRRRRGLYV